MNNEKAFLYDLCERTHTSRTLEKTIEDINAHLQKIAWRASSTASIKIDDKDNTKDIIVDFHNIYPSTINVTVGEIKDISFSAIYDFIYHYYEEQNIDIVINNENGNIELSWESRIQDYLDSQEKGFDISTAAKCICNDIEIFMGECETNNISLWFTFLENIDDEYDINYNSSNRLFNLLIPKASKPHCDMAELILNYFKNSEKYNIDIDTNAVSEVGTAKYILIKASSSDKDKQDQNADMAEPYDGGCVDVNKVIEDIESFLQTCCRIRKTKYIHLAIIFCDLNLEEDIFDGDLDNITYTIKLPDNDRGQAFLGDIYQYFQDNGKYDIEFRPIEKLSENRRYKISYHIEDKIDDTKSTSDAVAQTGKITAETAEVSDGDDILDGSNIIPNDKKRINWENIDNYLNYHLIENNDQYVCIMIQDGSENMNDRSMRVIDNIWHLDIKLHESDSLEVMAYYICEHCTDKGYDIRLSATGYNNVGRAGYMLYRVIRKK